MQPIASTSSRAGGQSLFDADQPFAHQGAAPAGFSGPSGGKKDFLGGTNEDPFADDEAAAAYTFSAPTDGPYAVRKRRGRWQRFKEDHLTDIDWSFGVDKLLRRKNKFDGIPREVLLNDPEGNRVKGYEKNSVSTGKYGPLTFLPKFLFCECSAAEADDPC
jgi:phospholipid-transporting ATPase